mmetsp:Transcript_119236/g.187060  ORF Transcript_119236/g.187060 Transcript_119236/m.187060 type:complete len:109 (+) Transcript_119236:3-329(+)
MQKMNVEMPWLDATFRNLSSGFCTFPVKKSRSHLTTVAPSGWLVDHAKFVKKRVELQAHLANAKVDLARGRNEAEDDEYAVIPLAKAMNPDYDPPVDMIPDSGPYSVW